MPLDPCIVKETFSAIEPVADQAMAYFYGRLFAEEPGLRALFPAAMTGQRIRMFEALSAILAEIDTAVPDNCQLARLGRDHRKFGVLPEHYPVVGRALIATVRRFAGAAWTPAAEQAWQAAYSRITTVMIRAAAEAATTSPAWWFAEITEHELRTPDIAVLTLAPDRPVPFRAGQHISVQTARWPRVWRRYSLANAPRGDGRLRLHVRAVPGGWVSTTLVRHVRVGHTLLLGPAQGAMTVDPGSGRDILCVAGGTGLAPVKSIVEQVVAAGGRRSVHLFLGARRSAELYDMTDLIRLASGYPWLRVIPVVSDEPGYDGPRGPVGEVAAGAGGWSGHDVYVSGPDEMVRSTVALLRASGCVHVHHDLLDTPDPSRPATALH